MIFLFEPIANKEKMKVYVIKSTANRLQIHNKLRKKGLHWVKREHDGWQVDCDCGYTAVVAWYESTRCLGNCGSRQPAAIPAKEIVASADKLDGCKCIKCRPELNAVLRLLPQPIYEELFECVYR
jgi:hypothetical protein